MKIKLANRLGLSLAPYPTPLKNGPGSLCYHPIGIAPGPQGFDFHTGSELLSDNDRIGTSTTAREMGGRACNIQRRDAGRVIEPDRHLDLYRFALHFCRLAIALTIFLGAFLMQISTTTRGEFVRSPRRADRVDGSRNRRSPWILPQATPRSSPPPPNVGQIYR